MDKNTKNGVRIALEEIKKLQRYDLCWEWMSESKEGIYILRSEVIKRLIKILKS